MKKMLRAILAWLDRKFPDMVTVTLAEYTELQARLKRAEDVAKATDDWAKKTNERLEKAENAINNLNVSAGFGGIADKMKAGVFVR